MTNFDSTSSTLSHADNMEVKMATQETEIDLESFSIEVMIACDTHEIDYADHVEAAQQLRKEEPAVFDSIRKGNGWVPAPTVEIKLDTKSGLVLCSGE